PAIVAEAPQSALRNEVAQIVLSLGRAGRLVNCADVHTGTCGNTPNPQEVSMADIVLTGENCACNHEGKRRCRLQAYPFTPFVDEILELCYSQLSRVAPHVWEGACLRDVCAHTTSFSIVDRNIGLHWDATYETTLNWLQEKLRAKISNCAVDVYTSPRDRDIHRQLNAFCAPRNITLHCRERRGFPHARYLLADKVGLQIDYGFQLLVDGMLDPSEIWLKVDAATVLQPLRNARNFVPNF